MITWKRPQALGVALALVAVVGIGVLGAASAAQAQQAAAVFSTVNGRVQFQNKGDTTWQTAQVGMRVFEGADVLSGPGSNAELRLPDGSTVLVAENSRFAVTKLDFDSQNRMRSSFFHLATGKLRGFVAKAAAALVAARQNNFAITTPTAVAAVRGTTLYATVDAAGNATFFCEGGVATIVLPPPPGSPPGTQPRTVTIQPGQATTITPAVAANPSAPPPPAVTPTPAQRAQYTSTTVTVTATAPGTQAALNQATKIEVPSADTTTSAVQVVVNMPMPPPAGTPATAPAAVPTVTITPPPVQLTPSDLSSGKK